MSKTSMRMSFDENYALRVKLLEDYGTTMTLDTTGAKIAKRLQNELGFTIGPTHVYKAAKSLGISSKHIVVNTKSKQLADMLERLAVLEDKVCRLCRELGDNT